MQLTPSLSACRDGGTMMTTLEEACLYFKMVAQPHKKKKAERPTTRWAGPHADSGTSSGVLKKTKKTWKMEKRNEKMKNDKMKKMKKW